jgi:hypothetical protein
VFGYTGTPSVTISDSNTPVTKILTCSGAASGAGNTLTGTYKCDKGYVEYSFSGDASGSPA